MTDIFSPEFTRRLDQAYAEVKETPGLLVLGLRQPRGGRWSATVALDDVAQDRIIHSDDPSLFTEEDDDAPTAIRLALARAKRALAV